MKKNQIESILNHLLSTGGDFAEVFIENKKAKTFNYIDNQLEQLNINLSNGIGLRLAKNNNIYYGASSDVSMQSINQMVEDLKKNVNEKVIYQNISLKRLKKYKTENATHYTDIEIKNKLKEINQLIRKKEKKISQVNLVLQNVEQQVTIANQTGLYTSENRVRSRFFIIINFQDGDKTSSIQFNKGMSTSIDLLDTIDYEKIIDELIKKGLDELYAKPCIGKVMPVVIGPAFGGVIFHEACGHAMEATSVAEKTSVLSYDLNKQIASPKVTIIDDGSIPNEWGSTIIDDEGHLTQKNVLIKNGVLKSFLIDELNNRKMKQKATGSSRRESYLYAPTSRMNNTYLAPGTDKIEDMIKSIDYGLYAVEMIGGCVSTETGDFNFSCGLAYMIRDGKIAECVKSASLIGNTKEILKEVEMVSDNLSLGAGICGSISGYVPVNIGQPTIKIGHILVGGENNEE